MVATFVDLSQPFFNGMPHPKAHGDARFWVDKETVEVEARRLNISVTHMEMAAHIGTHIDAARHFVADGLTIDQYPLSRFVGPAVVLDVRRDGVVPLTADELRHASPSIEKGDIVLLYFGYAERFRDDSYYDHPFLSPDAADYLVEQKVSILGVDTVTPDLPGRHRPADYDFPVHTRLLGNDVLVIENLGPGLKEVLGKRIILSAFPFRIEGGDASPIVPVATVI